jgi:hypothetical protein
MRYSLWLRKWLNLPERGSKTFFGVPRNVTSRSKWIQVHCSSIYAQSTPILSNNLNKWFFEENSESRIDQAGLVVLESGFVHGHNGGQYFDCNQNYYWDLGRENWRYFSAFFMDTVLALPRPQKLNGTVAVLAHEYAYTNFSHWVFDVLPKIQILKDTCMIDKVDWFLVGHKGTSNNQHK